MSSRKQTPDVLGEILGGPAAPQPAEISPTPGKAARTASRRRSTKTHTVPSTTSPQPAVQEWEYREVVFRDFRGWRPKIVNGVEQRDWKNAPLLHEYLATLGNEGWELVSMGNPRHNEKEAYLKRPRSGQ